MTDLPDILRTLVESRRKRLVAAAVDPAQWPIGLPSRDEPLSGSENRFVGALERRRGEAVIAEIKLGSPRLGSLVDRIDPDRQTSSYVDSGASAISVVVEPDHFFGSYELLAECRDSSGLPALAKDFVIHPVQIDWARSAGADAVLLIAALLEGDSLRELAGYARACDLVPLVETHGADDRDALQGADWELVGVNHRDLRTFDVSLDRSEAALRGLPGGALKVAESGIRCGEDTALLSAAGFDAFLVGEALLLSSEPGAMLEDLIAGARRGKSERRLRGVES